VQHDARSKSSARTPDPRRSSTTARNWWDGWGSNPRPVSDFLRSRALQQAASAQELENAGDKAALADRRAREAAGQTSYVPRGEALRRPGLAG
jgi:hypothetical protein